MPSLANTIGKQNQRACLKVLLAISVCTFPLLAALPTGLLRLEASAGASKSFKELCFPQPSIFLSASSLSDCYRCVPLSLECIVRAIAVVFWYFSSSQSSPPKSLPRHAIQTRTRPAPGIANLKHSVVRPRMSATGKIATRLQDAALQDRCVGKGTMMVGKPSQLLQTGEVLLPRPSLGRGRQRPRGA